MKKTFTTLIGLLWIVNAAASEPLVKDLSIGTKLTITGTSLRFIQGQRDFEMRFQNQFGTTYSSSCHMILKDGATENGSLTLQAPIEMTVVSKQRPFYSNTITLNLMSNKPDLESITCSDGAPLIYLFNSIELLGGTIAGPNDRVQ